MDSHNIQFWKLENGVENKELKGYVNDKVVSLHETVCCGYSKMILIDTHKVCSEYSNYFTLQFLQRGQDLVV